MRDLRLSLLFVQLILFGRLIPAYKTCWRTRGNEDFYRAGFTIAFAIHSVDSSQSLDPRLRRVVGHFTPAALGAA